MVRDNLPNVCNKRGGGNGRELGGRDRKRRRNILELTMLNLSRCLNLMMRGWLCY